MTNKQIEKKSLPAIKQVEFKSGENLLRGSFFVPKGIGPFPGVLFFHGSGGRGEKYFEAGKKFMENGILAFVFNFTGCGESSGNYLTQTHKDAFRDAKIAFNKLLDQKNIDKNRIGIVGGSFGGYVASMTLPELDVSSLVLLSPSAHDDSYDTKIDMGSIQKEVEYFNNEYNWINSEAYKNISEFKGSLLVVKSENDENVPSTVVDKYYQKSKSKIKKQIILKGADHRLSTYEMREEFYKIVTDWFLKIL